MKICFDLEGTLIKSWSNHEILWKNVELIKNILPRFQRPTTEYHVFSFAIYDNADKNAFAVELQTRLENIFGIQFSKVWSMDEMASNLGMPSRLDLFPLGKEHTHYLLYHDQPSVLFDDVVQNKTNGNCEYINVE